VTATHQWIRYNLFFATAIVGAWSWFHLAPAKSTPRYHLSIQTNIPGWNFEPIPLSQEAVKTLATPNIFNGVYQNQSGERFNVFWADWSAENPREMDVLVHTPDICWTSAGWKEVPSELADSTSIKIGKNPIPFQLRTFVSPSREEQELCIWVTMINGKPFLDQYRFNIPAAATMDFRLGAAAVARQLNLGYFHHTILDRSPASNRKQFIRVSTAATSRVELTVQNLRQFVQEWIRCRLEI
jgi:Protein of unknown function (DUF3485)